MFYEFADIFGHVFFSNIPNDYIKTFANAETGIIHKKLLGRIQVKYQKIILENGTIAYCSTEQKEIVSNKVFRSKLNMIISLFDLILSSRKEIGEKINQDTKRLLHNVITLNAHNIQEIYAFIPQELLTKNIREQFEQIQEIILENPKEASSVFLRIAKNNAAMKSEFSVFKKLFDVEPNLQVRPHPIHKVVMNLLHIFFQDFTDLGVPVIVGDTDVVLDFDYESVHVALYHIIDNAVKYIYPNSALLISFIETARSFTIRFDMTSVEIEQDEVSSIFDEGYRGKNTKRLSRGGNGIGLNLVKRILALNNILLQIHVNVNKNKSRHYKGTPYSNNQFDIVFNLETSSIK